MNSSNYSRLLFVLAVVIVAAFSPLCCNSTPAPVSPGWQHYIGQPAEMSAAPADPDRMVPLDCRYRALVEESFTTLMRTPAEAFVLERGGTFGEIDGEPWIIGSSGGSNAYVPYYRTDPSLLQLRPQLPYHLKFDYRIINEPDQGFETIFYSPLGSAQNDWLPGVVITGCSANKGRASLQVRTNNYTDYQIRWNVIGNGSIAIRSIRVRESASGKVVAIDSGSHTSQGPSPAICVTGEWSTKEGGDGKTRLLLSGPATIFTNPEGVRLDGGGPDSGNFVGGGTTGRSDLPYRVGFELWEGAAIAISELRVVQKEPFGADSSTDPTAALTDLPFPRLGNYQQGMPEDIARNGCGTAVGADEWMSIAECERRLALFDEWCVDQSGRTVHGPEGKGWLGMALSPAVELDSGERVVVILDRAVTLHPALKDGFRVGDRQVLDDEPRQLIIEFDWQVTETLSVCLASNGIRAVHGTNTDRIWIKDPVAGAKGHERIHATLQPGEHGVFEFDPIDSGKVVLSNLRVVSAHAGLFRRDFEHGIVLVNATREPKTVQTGRPGVTRIHGVLDPETNDGRAVVGEITIPAADAIVLRVD